MRVRSIPWWLWLFAIGLLLVATERMPYGYYTFVRISVCLFAVVIACLGWSDDFLSRLWSAIFALTAILFNPIIPIHLSRHTWYPLDIGAAAIFAAHFAFVRLGVGIREQGR